VIGSVTVAVLALVVGLLIGAGLTIRADDAAAGARSCLWRMADLCRKIPAEPPIGPALSLMFPKFRLVNSTPISILPMSAGGSVLIVLIALIPKGNSVGTGRAGPSLVRRWGEGYRPDANRSGFRGALDHLLGALGNACLLGELAHSAIKLPRAVKPVTRHIAISFRYGS
jgi:hypothetical protein